ncbi:MAG: hypothetical protein ACRDVD_01290 [Acidimicrobiia bacterium]
MSVLTAVAVVLAGVVMVAVGSFSVVSLLWEDLLENDPPVESVKLPEAA